MLIIEDIAYPRWLYTKPEYCIDLEHGRLTGVKTVHTENALCVGDTWVNMNMVIGVQWHGDKTRFVFIDGRCLTCENAEIGLYPDLMQIGNMLVSKTHFSQLREIEGKVYATLDGAVLCSFGTLPKIGYRFRDSVVNPRKVTCAHIDGEHIRVLCPCTTYHHPLEGQTLQEALYGLIAVIEGVPG